MNKTLLFLKKLPPMTLTVVCVVIILYLTLAPKPLPDVDVQLFPGVDKVVHFIMFGGLAGAVVVDVARRGGVKKLTSALWACAALFSAVLGVITEVLQTLLLNGVRSGDFYDWLADAAGAVTGALSAIYLSKKLFK